MVDVLKLATQEKQAHIEAQQQVYYRHTWKARLRGNMRDVVGFAGLNVLIFTSRMMLQGYHLDQIGKLVGLLGAACLISGILFSIQDARFNFRDFMRRQLHPIQWRFIINRLIIFGLIGMIVYAVGWRLKIHPYYQSELITTNSTFRWALIGILDSVLFGMYILGSITNPNSRELSFKRSNPSSCLIAGMSLFILGWLVFLLALSNRTAFLVLATLAIGWPFHYWPRQADMAPPID